MNSIVIGGSEVIITQDQECVPQESLYDRKLSTLKYSLLHKIRNAYALLWKHFLQAFTNYYVIKWSAWWALSTCGYLQVANYMQLLWKTAVEPGDEIYNGAVDFLYAIIGKCSKIISVIRMRKLILFGDSIGKKTPPERSKDKSFKIEMKGFIVVSINAIY